MTAQVIVSPVVKTNHEDESYRVDLALGEVVAWFVEDGFTDEDIQARVDDAIERVREDEE